MNVLIIGSGGREHALAWKSAQDYSVKNVFVCPGNAGTHLEKKISNIDIDSNNFVAIESFCIEKNIGLVIIGPEQPLVMGLTDFLQSKGINAFGPSKNAAQLEGSKTFSKDFFVKYNIPTAGYKSFEDFDQAVSHLEKINYPTVVKADGLAAGKGVIICSNKDEAINALNSIFKDKAFGSAGNRAVIEDFLEGEEASFIAVVSKNKIIPLATSQDHKAVGDGDVGLNTGGMGAYSPSRLINNDLENKILSKIIKPTLKGLKNLGTEYKGFLYAGLMIVKNEPYLIEYNVRMGDPECQTILPKLKTDLLEIIEACCDKKLVDINIEWTNKKSLCVVLCSKGYPDTYQKNILINNLENFNLDENNFIFHAGTKKENDEIYAIGGRVLNFISLSDNFLQARNEVHQSLKKLDWNGGFYRRDIGFKVIN